MIIQLSLPINPDIAHICFLRRMIEKIGRGTIKIIEDCKSKGFLKPEWKSRSGFTTLTFFKISITPKINDTVSDAVNDASIKSLISVIRIILTSQKSNSGRPHH